MIRKVCLAVFLLVCAGSPALARHHHVRHAHPVRLDANGKLEVLIAKHAAANRVPESLVRRVIRRESGGDPRAVHNGNYGLMQIRLGTARAMGYRGSARGLLDAETNMTYAVKYLAGAYRVAHGDADRAVHYYAAGYYDAAKHERRSAKARKAGVPVAARAKLADDNASRY